MYKDNPSNISRNINPIVNNKGVLKPAIVKVSITAAKPKGNVFVNHCVV